MSSSDKRTTKAHAITFGSGDVIETDDIGFNLIVEASLSNNRWATVTSYDFDEENLTATSERWTFMVHTERIESVSTGTLVYEVRQGVYPPPK